MIVKLLTEHHLECLSVSESTHVKMSHCCNYTALMSVLIEKQLVLTRNQQYGPQVSCLKLSSNQYETDTLCL